MAVRTSRSRFPKSQCTIAWHLTNLILSSCNCVSTLMRDSSWRRSKRSTALVKSLTRPLSLSISVCCCWQSVTKLLGSTASLACSWASNPPLVRRERLCGAWRPGRSNFHCPNSFMRSVKWLNIFSLTCSFTAGRGPFWWNQTSNAKKKRSTTKTTATKQKKQPRIHPCPTRNQN